MTPLSVGKLIDLKGCFTFSGYLEGQNIGEIARRLGLLQEDMEQGIYIAHALRMPEVNEFELGGVTLDSTDKFVNYAGKTPQYSPEKFKELYKGANIGQIKKMYQDTFTANKLVKVLTVKPHPRDKGYPEGTIIPQFIITRPLSCMITAFIPPYGNFTHTLYG